MIAAEPVRTEVRYRHNSTTGYYPHPQGVVWWAEWKPLTVASWQTVLLESNYNSTLIHKSCWRRMLIRTNVVKSPHDFTDAKTSDAIFDRIMAFCPHVIPRDLVNQLLEKTIISRSEEAEIERQCQMLWLADNGSIQRPHPLVGIAVDMMNFHSQFGVPGYRTVGELPYKLYAAMKIISRAKSQIQLIQSQTKEVHNRAIQMGRGVIPSDEWSMYANGPPPGMPVR